MLIRRARRAYLSETCSIASCSVGFNAHQNRSSWYRSPARCAFGIKNPARSVTTVSRAAVSWAQPWDVNARMYGSMIFQILASTASLAISAGEAFFCLSASRSPSSATLMPMVCRYRNKSAMVLATPKIGTDTPSITWLSTPCNWRGPEKRAKRTGGYLNVGCQSFEPMASRAPSWSPTSMA